MSKKMAAILAMSIFFGSGLNAFAEETNIIENTNVIENTQDVFPVETEITQEIETIQEIEITGETIEEAEDIQIVRPDKREVIVQLDDTLAWINGEEYKLATLPKVIEGRTYLPLRFMADKLLEASVDWDAVAKEVTIIKDGTIVQVKIGSKDAFVDGYEMELENPPIIAHSTTYLPLRTMAELFEIQTDYNEETRQITLTKIQDGMPPKEIKPAIPQFSFVQEEYTAGQIVRAIDESFHEDGMKITNRLWMINFDEKKTNSKLENMFSKPGAGHYSVSLRVEAGKDNWSEWETKEITIKPNQKPVVTTLLTSKESYAGGEAIDFTYAYENEPWENIKAERWTYRDINETLSKAVVEKPKFMFNRGQYIITLQLQDDYNNWSDPKEVIVTVDTESKQTELEYRFTQGNAGDIIDNFQNFNYLNYATIIPKETVLKSGNLLISNSPENVKSNGILYRDTVEGVGRILFHHHNSFTEEENLMERKRLVLMAENTTHEPASFTISNKVEKGPSNDILYVGQQLLYDYLKGAGETKYVLNPGEKMYIYDSVAKKWDKGQLISVQMDFNVTGKVTLTTAAIGKDTKIDDIAGLPELDKDAHPRGTFDKTDIYHKVEIDGGEPTRLILGAGTQEWFNGYDAITGQIVQNRGNYAVNYYIQITAQEDTGIMLNPRAGEFRGALKWDGEEPFLAPSKGYFMGHNSKGVMLGVIKAGETRTLEYSLPNGSASPVLLVFMPKSDW